MGGAAACGGECRPPPPPESLEEPSRLASAASTSKFVCSSAPEACSREKPISISCWSRACSCPPKASCVGKGS